MKLPKRIAYVFRTGGFGGAELNLLTLLRRLDRTRFEPVVYLYCTNAKTDQKIREELARIPVLVMSLDVDGVPLPPSATQTIRSTQPLQPPTASSAHQSRSSIKQRILALLPKSLKLAWHYRTRIHEAGQHFRAARIDVIHFLHGGYPSLWIPMIASRRTKIPIRIADVLLDPRPMSSADIGWIRGGFAWWAGRCMTRMRAMSERMKQQLIRLWRIPADRIVVIGNWVDLTRFHELDGAIQLRRELDLPATAKLVTVVARLSPEKGHQVLIAAASQLLDRHPDAYYLFLGDGPLRADLETQVQAHALSDRVRFLGFRDDVPQWLSGSTLAVLPSFVEGAPAAVLEAMAAGKPVIATDVGGVREIVEDGVMGRIVRPNNADQLSLALDELLGAKASRLATMGARARAHVQRHCSVDHVVRSIVALYNDEAVVR